VVDALKVQTVSFRRLAPLLAFLLLLVVWVVSRYMAVTYDGRGGTVVVNITDTGFGRPVLSTAEGQIGQCAFTFAVVLFAPLVRMATDPLVEVACFSVPIRMTHELALVARQVGAQDGGDRWRAVETAL
jgi:hypothetical protein